MNPSVAEVRDAWPDLVPKGGGLAGPCPVCGGNDRFHVKDRGDGTALIGCRGCIDNEPPDVRHKAYGKVMRILFPDSAPPPRTDGAGKVSTIGAALPKSREGLRLVLTALGYEWRYNTRRMRDELRHKGGDWREANDRLIRDLRSQIPERFTEAGRDKALMFGRESFDDCFGALLNRAEVDPFREWLEALPPWHREERLEIWLGHVFNVSDEQAALAAWVSRFLMLGAVWRTYRPGTKLDEMPVFIGPQGCGKSTALRELLPPEHPEFFSDGLRLAADDKVRAEALQGRVIVEAAEMAGSTRAEQASRRSCPAPMTAPCGSRSGAIRRRCCGGASWPVRRMTRIACRPTRAAIADSSRSTCAPARTVRPGCGCTSRTSGRSYGPKRCTATTKARPRTCRRSW